LREQGLEMLTDGFRDTSHLMLAVRGLLRPGVHPPRAFTVLDRMQEQAASSTAERVLISQETLAPATATDIDGLVRRLAGHEVHVVVTARDIARQVPSAWQERVKTRSTVAYEDFLHDVVHRGPAAEQFWKVHDLPAVLDRWSQAVGAGHVHVVTVPQRGAAPDLLLERFCGLLGVDPAGLTRESARSNSSIGLVQAELMRRVNETLGGRLPEPHTGYGPMGKRMLGERILASQPGRAPLLPVTMAPWCARIAAEWQAAIRDRGYDVVGELGDLAPLPSAFADQPPPVTDEELLDAATEAIAGMLDQWHQEREQSRDLRRTLRETERELGSARRALRGEADRMGRPRAPAAGPNLLSRILSRVVRGRR
jgi:hypothetical protein